MLSTMTGKSATTMTKPSLNYYYGRTGAGETASASNKLLTNNFVGKKDLGY